MKLHKELKEIIGGRRQRFEPPAFKTKALKELILGTFFLLRPEHYNCYVCEVTDCCNK